MPVVELTVGGIVPSPVVITSNQIEYSFGHDLDQDGSSILQLGIGDELITFNWSTPLNAQLTARNLAPYRAPVQLDSFEPVRILFTQQLCG